MPHRSLRAPWTPEEIEKLRKLSAAGASPTKISAALNRSLGRDPLEGKSARNEVAKIAIHPSSNAPAGTTIIQARILSRRPFPGAATVFS